MFCSHGLTSFFILSYSIMIETPIFKKKPLDISLYLYIIMVTIIVIDGCIPMREEYLRKESRYEDA